MSEPTPSAPSVSTKVCPNCITAAAQRDDGDDEHDERDRGDADDPQAASAALLLLVLCGVQAQTTADKCPSCGNEDATVTPGTGARTQRRPTRAKRLRSEIPSS